MNVVGRVGSLISQGVYSVATPFHPFGGAVDVIVVQQQDGTFRSTPWYVRFGKFQGVLKGAEKIVRITVNGVEANFHMYLDNSGEAYFVREVDSGKGDKSNVGEDSIINGDSDDNTNQNIIATHRLEHSVSDSRVLQMRDECNFLTGPRIERVESDVGGRFYDFQDDQSSSLGLDNSVEMSEYGSGRFESGESSGENSEVVLVSVDGHILMAPILASEEGTENVQLSTPQFHLGPAEATAFCEGNEEFDSGEDAWAADYISQLEVSTASVGHELKVCEGEGEHVCQSEEDESSRMKKREAFMSCLELTNLAQLVENLEEKSSEGPKDVCAVEFRENGDLTVEAGPTGENEFSPSCDSYSAEINATSADLDAEVVPTDEKVLDSKQRNSKGLLVYDSFSNNLETKDEQFDASTAILEINNSSQIAITNEESHTKSSTVKAHTHLVSKFEISLCGNELRPGMGPHAAAEAFDAHRISSEEFEISATSIVKNENLVIRFGERYLLWENAAPIVLGSAAFGLDILVGPKDAISVEEEDESARLREEEPGTPTTPSSRRWRLWPNPFRRVKTLEHTNSSTSSNEEVFVDSESALLNSEETPTSQHSNDTESPRKQFVRTNVPTNEQIASLNLKEGQNMIAFTFSTRVLGTQKVDAHIYLWMWNARIVISDVDGTITKSDVLGQFMPLVGKDWTQSGVARLFSAIKENGYQLLFLSARAIVQAYLTRSFLLNLKQDGKALPSGPVVISPDGLFPSLFREVIRRAPHEFKIACLEDIKKLFPSDYNPFYAGFGNRDTDELSYRKIGIPKGKIFIINPKGEVAISHRIDVKSYTSLHTLVNDMFPPTSLVEQEDYNSWNFWKVPLPDI